MTNPYLKHTKFGAGCGSHNFLTDQYNLVTGFWSKKGLTGGLTEFSEESGLQDTYRAVTAKTTVPGSPVKSGTDGWAKYFWDTKKKIVTYVNPSSGKKVTVKPSDNAYKAITTKVNWVDSTPASMKSQKSQDPKVTAIAPIDDDLDLFPVKQKKGIVDKTVTYAKENPLVAGGIGLGVVTVLGLTSMLAFGGSGNQEMITITDEHGGTIEVPANATRWTYTAEFQDDERHGPYVVKPIKMTALQAKNEGEVTYAQSWHARKAGEESVEAYRRNMTSNPYRYGY